MPFKEITVQQAYDLLQKESDCVYIDVRTVPEFVSGHPAMALNIPVAVHDPNKGMTMNEEFVAVVEAHFPKDRKLIIGCQAGPRANAAAKLLQDAGYQEVSSMWGGFGGMRNPSGQIVAPGWSTLGYPVSQDNGEGVSYESLRAKIR